LLNDFDGIRLDHPHGLVCPWVYDASDADPTAAVGRGARLRCSPNLADHPRLRALAIPTVGQISQDPGIARYADEWVRDLTEAQVTEYGLLFDVVMTAVAAAGRKQTDVVCEVLSTWPYPLRRVMERYDLGRFCVTQKADLARPEDVYRSENTSPRDWIMVGNHDTPPLWALAEAWQGSAAWSARALYLAERLAPDPTTRPTLARWIAADPRHLCHAMVADLFAAPARRVSLFFPDLFGMKAVYNRPGVVDPENWTLRLPGGFDDAYGERLQSGRALNLPLALALALAAHASNPLAPNVAALGRRLIQAARALSPIAEIVPAWLDRLFP
ncbi:MAG TPA: 4-alpha-glucanotransferase, partial [Polyangia bacterium]|nr:4-alpha-glucanotransferase [Polyangia bacterium]